MTSTLESAAYSPFALLLQDIEEEIGNENMEPYGDSEKDLKYRFHKLAVEAFEKLELPKGSTTG